jgi:hypothetical protein
MQQASVLVWCLGGMWLVACCFVAVFSSTNHLVFFFGGSNRAVLSSVARCLHFFDRSSRVRPGSRSLFLASHLGGPKKVSKKKATPLPAPATRVPAAMTAKTGSAKTRFAQTVALLIRLVSHCVGLAEGDSRQQPLQKQRQLQQPGPVKTATVCHRISPSSQPTPSGLSELVMDVLQVRRTGFGCSSAFFWLLCWGLPRGASKKRSEHCSDGRRGRTPAWLIEEKPAPVHRRKNQPTLPQRIPTQKKRGNPHGPPRFHIPHSTA